MGIMVIIIMSINKSQLNHLKLTKVVKLIWKMSIIRSIYYSLKFRARIIVSSSTKISSKPTSKILVNSKKWFVLGLEYDSTIEKVHINLDERSTLIIKGNVSIKKGVQISLAQGAKLSIGDKTFINECSKIFIYKSCHIGEECAISWDVTITDSDVHRFLDKEPEKEVYIGNKVWIGFGVCILKGSYIGDGCVISSKSLVNKSFKDNQLIAGIPANVKLDNVSWK